MSTPNRGGRGANVPASDRATKADRKEQARQEREAIQRDMARKRRTRSLLVGGLLALAVVALVAIVMTSRSQEPSTPSGELPGMMTSTTPWGPNVEDLAARLEILGLPGLSEEILHRHTRLEINVNGQPVEVPANLGINQAAGVFSPLHTHDVDGVVHTESDDADFSPNLGTLFDVWGLRLSDECIGAYCAEGDKELRVFVDGEEVTGDPREVALTDLSVIVVTYGTEEQLPDPIPSEFVPQ